MKMRAILIDPFTCTVTEVEYNGDWRTIKQHISHETMRVSTITALHRISPEGDCVYLDDNGLLHNPPVKNFFFWDKYPQQLAGKGLVLGVSEDGETIETKLTVSWVQQRVVFAIAGKDKDGRLILFRNPLAGGDTNLPLPAFHHTGTSPRRNQ